MAILTDDPAAAIPLGARTPARFFATAITENILRVTLTAGEAASPDSSLVLADHTAIPMIELAPTGSDPVRIGGFDLRLDPDSATLVEIAVPNGSEPLLRLKSASLEPVALQRFDTGGEPPDVEAVRTVDGERTFIRNLRPTPDGLAYRAVLRFALAPGEGRYGLGQEEDGGFQRRGTKVHLYQHNMRIPMPCVISDRGYGVLFDCTSLMTYDATGADELIELNATDSVDFYLIAGGVAAVARGFRQLTGAAPLLPKWAFGYVQSKERYETSAELVAVARRHRELGVPLDCVVQDWKTWVGDQWGQKTVDPQRFPDLAAMKADLESLDVHSMVSVWPNMATGCPDHQEFAAAGLLLCDHSTYDAFDARGRDLYWRQLHQLFHGFDSWWCDSTEPFSAPDWQGSVRLDEDRRFELVGREHERCLGARRANLYALEHARGIYEHELAEQQAGTAPVRRVLNLTRSGYPGSQRYGAVLWSGDVSATWADLRGEITKAITMGLCGVPWWTTDAGAFFVGGTACWRRWCGDPDADPVWFWRGDYDDGVANAGYRELYVRWLQFAAMLAMFRSHGTDTPREIWQFGAPGDPCYDAIETTISLRYRLLPYIYTVAAEAALRDEVMVRGLLFDFADDPEAVAVADQFLLGSKLLACPVTAASYYGEDGAELPGSGPAVRSVYLPGDAGWWDYWTGEYHRGGQRIEVLAPLERLPLFVRAGSVLAVQEPVQHALANRDRFDLVVYPGADGGGSLYDDDGLSHDYQAGDYSLLEFDWDDAARRLSLSATSWVREEPMQLTVRLGEQCRQLTYDGTQLSVSFEETA